MKSINEDKMVKLEIYFSSSLNEEYLKTLAHKVEQILKSMITGKHSPVSIKGDESKVKAFAKALGNEERYILALQEAPIDNPEVMGLRHKLEEAIANFEKVTGIKWPVR